MRTDWAPFPRTSFVYAPTARCARSSCARSHPSSTPPSLRRARGRKRCCRRLARRRRSKSCRRPAASRSILRCGHLVSASRARGARRPQLPACPHTARCHPPSEDVRRTAGHVAFFYEANFLDVLEVPKRHTHARCARLPVRRRARALRAHATVGSGRGAARAAPGGLICWMIFDAVSLLPIPVIGSIACAVDRRVLWNQLPELVKD